MVIRFARARAGRGRRGIHGVARQRIRMFVRFAGRSPAMPKPSGMTRYDAGRGLSSLKVISCSSRGRCGSPQRRRGFPPCRHSPPALGAVLPAEMMHSKQWASAWPRGFFRGRSALESPPSLDGNVRWDVEIGRDRPRASVHCFCSNIAQGIPVLGKSTMAPKEAMSSARGRPNRFFLGLEAAGRFRDSRRWMAGLGWMPIRQHTPCTNRSRLQDCYGTSREILRGSPK